MSELRPYRRKRVYYAGRWSSGQLAELVSPYDGSEFPLVESTGNCSRCGQPMEKHGVLRSPRTPSLPVVCPGDWVVYYENGTTDVWPEEMFKREFELVREGKR